jgi:hypothetical protein
MNTNWFFFVVFADNTTKTALYQVPGNATTVDKLGSKCGATEDTLKVSWDAGNSFIVNFASNSSKYDLTLLSVTLNVSSLFNDSAGELWCCANDSWLSYRFFISDIFFSVNQTVTVTYTLPGESYDIPSNFSYHCNRDQKLNATDGSNFFVVSHVQFEAFRHDNNDKFAVAKDCDSNITPDIVPIAVGISLIALIVVVLIAYIVGRRRQLLEHHVKNFWELQAM